MKSPKKVLLAALFGWSTWANSQAVVNQNGIPSCPCLEWAGLSKHIVNDKLVVTPAGSGTSYQYPSSYGQWTCKAHDYGLPPLCSVKDAPAWCSQPWCYVGAACTGATKASTSKLGLSDSYAQLDIFWSYETCANSNAYLTASATSQKAVGNLLTIIEGYLRSARSIIEIAYQSTSPAATCPYSDMCSCGNKCVTNPIWKAKMDFANVGTWIRKSAPQGGKNIVSCLARAASGVFQKIATKEADSGHTRPGYLYFGDQDTGSLVQWPNQDQCLAESGSEAYDPRYRPWYAGAVTGPKDIIIVVDVSGSMATSKRDLLARLAVKKIIDTLTWKDFAAVILFNHGVYMTSDTLMKSMTEPNRNALQAWADTNNWKSGGTNFVAAMDKAFSLIGASVTAGTTSMCQKLIMFLTDGEAQFSEADFARVRENSVKYDTQVLTYALGSGAEKTITKRLACENRGIFYAIPDNADLSTLMASYYEYLAAGQQMCTPSYIKFKVFGGDTELYGGCMPSYNLSPTNLSVVGVTCMDVNVLVDPPVLKQQTAWSHLVCKMSDVTKTCQPMFLDECQRQKIRLAVGEYSVCGANNVAEVAKAKTDKCGCSERTCFDNKTFVDELGYFCHQWIGDDCTKATEWKMSAQGQSTLLSQCPEGCGKCKWLSPCPYAARRDCSEHVPGPAECHSCLGKTSGVDIEGNPMWCPGRARPGTSSSSSATTATTGDSDDNTGMMVALFCAITGFVSVLAFAVWKFCKRKTPQSYPAAAPVAPAVVSPAPVAPVAQTPSRPAPAAVGASTSLGASQECEMGPATTNTAVIKSKILPAGTTAGLADMKVPSLWKHQDLNFEFHLETVSDSEPKVAQIIKDMVSTTFKQITTRDRAGGKLPSKLSVQTVQRIENSKIWKQYVDARATIKAKRPHKCTSIQTRSPVLTMAMRHELFKGMDDRNNEVFLWHGTNPTAAAAIAQTGFDLSRAGTGAGTMYGNGVYLAECSSKSDEYAKTDDRGLFPGMYCLLLCRVVLGEFLTMGPGGTDVHPIINAAMESGQFECVLGDREASVGTYREFIVYTQAQVYPEYIVTYKRE